MMHRGILYWVLLIIAISTVVSGLVQLVNPGFVLGLVGAEQSLTANHFFAIVGMFMVLFGGLLWQALASAAAPPMVLLWAGLQKFGASAAVGLGAARHVFGSTSLLVAGFDLLSGILIFVYWASVRKAGNGK